MTEAIARLIQRRITFAKRKDVDNQAKSGREEKLPSTDQQLQMNRYLREQH
ncbi:hypothetical protein T10_689 [Trichinella papuae]|uniref:Uncharacterized protein n=1 Tax=Trichinella papuae TaxID=268474 RepID=A0A0V1MQ25_9BILA|nr:hypothetical protein T10_689 [Trichinella papuae]